MKYATEHWANYASSHNCSLIDFITEQMKKDAQAMGFTVKKLPIYDISKTTNTYNTWYYYNHNDNNTGTQFVYNT